MKMPFVRLYRITRWGWTLCLFGDPQHNPLLSVGRGPQGWLVMTRKRQWQSPGLREHFDEVNRRRRR